MIYRTKVVILAHPARSVLKKWACRAHNERIDNMVKIPDCTSSKRKRSDLSLKLFRFLQTNSHHLLMTMVISFP